MNVTSRLTALILWLVLIICCAKQIDCPEFNNEILEWIPYQNNDTIRLINTSNDSIILLVIIDVTIEHTTHYKSNLDCGTCDDQIIVNGNDTNINDLEININLNENIINAQSFLIKGDYFTEYNTNYSEQTNYSFEGINYEVVRVFEKKVTGEIFNTLIIAKGYGIVGLINNEGDIWIINEANIKGSKDESIEIKNISCG